MVVNCWKNARVFESEDVGENVVVDEITQDDIQSDLEIYSAVTGKTKGASAVEYLSVDDEALVFEAYTDESIIEELNDNLPIEDSDGDDDSDVISEKPPPLMELIGQLEIIQQVASSIPSVSAQQLIALDEIKTRESLRKKKQKNK